MELNEKVPSRFRLLFKHASIMKESGMSIDIPCDYPVFGADKRIYALSENIIALCTFGMIGQAAIATYML